jgi:hypothetical protein
MPTLAEDEAELDAFQTALLELFAENLHPEDTLRRLREDPAFAGHRDWVGGFEARLVEVGSGLVRIWSRR